MLRTGAVSGVLQTAIDGGSFLTALRNDAVSDVAAAGAYAIGNAEPGLMNDLGPVGGEGAYISLHAAVGCAAGAATGQGCGGGAIGGAASAALNPLVDSALGGNTPPAVLVAMSMLAGGGIAGALGYNVQGATTAAENETLNNYLDHRQVQNLLTTLKGCAPGDTACVSQTVANYQSISTQQQAAQNCNSVTGCADAKNDAANAVGVSESDIESACQGGTQCTQLLDSLANQGVNAKGSANQRWNDISNAVYAQNALQALISSGYSPTTSTIWSALSPFFEVVRTYCTMLPEVRIRQVPNILDFDDCRVRQRIRHDRYRGAVGKCDIDSLGIFGNTQRT